jgi:hypothetical protein
LTILWFAKENIVRLQIVFNLNTQGSFILNNCIKKIESFGKSFNQLTKETVKAFLIDSKKSNFKI